MSSRDIRTSASLSAATISGALIGFGVRLRAPAALLSATGDRLRGIPAFVAPDRSVGPSAAIGLAHALLAGALWGALAASLARGERGATRVGIVAVTALISVWADRVAPAALSISSGVASPPQRVLLALALTAAVLSGMGFAFQASAARTLNSERRATDTGERDQT